MMSCPKWNGRTDALDIVAPVLAWARVQSAKAVRVVCGTATGAEEETVNDERIAEHATEVIAWLHSEEGRGWTYNDLELRIRLAIRGALADTRLSEHSRRIAELEQANRDLERLRAEASREREEAQERHQNAEHDLGWLRLRTSSLKQELAGEREHSESMYRRACAEQSRAETAERERDGAREHRRILREALEDAQHRWLNDGVKRCPTCGQSEGLGHFSSCIIGQALAATKQS